VRFFALEKLINLHDNYTRQFKIDDLNLQLVQRDGELFLFESRCPHRGHSLDVASIEEGVLECPLHRYRFSLADGALLAATEEPCRGMRVFPVVYEGSDVGVMLDDFD